MSAINLAARFTCELAALAWCGWSVNPLLGVVFPLLLAAVWGAWIAPKARRRLRDPWRFVLELAVFAVATAAFASVGQPVVAAVFAAAALVTAALVRVWPEPVA